MPSHISSVSSSSSEGIHELDLREDKEWEDVEPDEEPVSVVCLFGNGTFKSVHAMLQHCHYVHNVDVVRFARELDLTFLETIKMINFIRSEVKRGNITPDLSSKSAFEDDQYLRPVLEDDVLLYSLEDMMGSFEKIELPVTNGTYREITSAIYDEDERVSVAVKRVMELQKEVEENRIQFLEYKNTVDKALETRWNNSEDNIVKATTESANKMTNARENDDYYFHSYSSNDIHETMLKDTVRTDAYRDFIKDNKYLFEGKIVLDVGCGTGILSMFCAQAGAAKVIAVDKSNIIQKARENVHENHLENIITCLQGKIEEVPLPVTKVDIIVSEWMGYCLLYEAMLDSVLWARDHYLTPDGLMVPSHVTLHIAPLADPAYIAEHITYWESVYGFKMSSMLDHVYNNVFADNFDTSSQAALSYPFLHLPLHSATKDDLTFISKPFTLRVEQDIASIDGFLIWFDVFFLPWRALNVSATARAEHWSHGGGPGIAFTTGPSGPSTHWRQGVLLVDRRKRPPMKVEKGQLIRGLIGYQKCPGNQRQLDVEVLWEVIGGDSWRAQVWHLE